MRSSAIINYVANTYEEIGATLNVRLRFQVRFCIHISDKDISDVSIY